MALTKIVGDVVANTITLREVSVTGNVSFSNTVSVTGNATFSNTVSVTGNATFSNLATFSANISISNTRISANGSTGTAGQALLTGGSSSNVYWGNVTGMGSRVAVSNTTSSIANGASGTITFPGYVGYALYKVQTNGAAWVRIYANSSSLSADSSRTEGTDPSASAGVIAEVITTGSSTVSFTPAVLGFNDESPVTNVIPVAVMNKTGSTGTVTVTMTLVQMEV